MTSVGLYLRISKDTEGNELGVSRQRDECLVMMEHRGWTVTEEYVDNDLSASRYSKKPRPRYLQMMEDIKAGKIDTVVTWDLDRLLRKPREGEDWIDLSETHEINLVTTSGDTDLTTDTGQMMFRFKINVSSAESDRKSTRVTSFNSQLARNGVPMIGKRAFGWEKDRVTVRPAEAAQIQWAHDQLINNGGSLHSIARHWNATGVQTSMGNEWVTQQVKAVMVRERNAGLLVRKGEIQETSTIEAIVTRQQHDAVMAIIRTNAKVRPGVVPVLGWLTGLSVCGVCGAPMRPKNVTSKGVRQKFYLCETKVVRTKADTRRHVAITATALEEVIKHEVLLAFMSGSSALLTNAEDTNLSALGIRLGQIADKRQQLLDAVTDLDAVITMAHIRPQLVSLAAEEKTLTEHRDKVFLNNAQAAMLASARASIIGPDHRVDWDAAIEVKDALSKRYDEQPVETRQTLVRDLLDVTVNPGYGPKRVDVVHKVVTSLNEEDAA